MPKIHDTIANEAAAERRETQIAKDDRVRHQSALIRQLQKKIVTLETQVGGTKLLADAVRETIVAATPYPMHVYRKAERTGTRIVPVFVWSDWHIGERINVREVEGFNRYDFQIARARVFELVDSFLAYVETNRAIYTIDEVVIIICGDMISGNIHKELEVTNEFPLPEQAVKAGGLVAEAIRRLAPHFKVVTVEIIDADNHSRLEHKPQAKLKVRNSMCFVVSEIIERTLAGIRNIRIARGESAKRIVAINGKRFLVQHGDGIKGQMGIPYYGFNRMIGKEAKRRMNAPAARRFDYVIMGHWHVPAIIEEICMVNGSLSGTTEYDHEHGRHSAPSQIAFFVHPKHGFFNFTAFRPKV